MRRGVRGLTGRSLTGKSLAGAALAGLVMPAVLAGLAGCGPAGSGSLGPAPSGVARSGSAGPASAGPGSAGPGGAAGPGAASAGAGGAGAAAAPGGAGGAAAGVLTVQVWLMRGGQLFSSGRTVAVTKATGHAAMTALLAGPDAAERAAGVTSAIPAGTRLLGLGIAGGTATVDLSGGFGQAGGGAAGDGTAGDGAAVGGAAGGGAAGRLAQVVYTLTQFPTVSRVRFEIGGTGVTTVAGVPVQQAQTRAAYASWLPPITVTAPLIGAAVRSPVTVTGTADVFEAAVSLRVLGAAGSEIARSFTTASCGTGCRGGYAATVTYSVSHAQPGTIEVYEVSAKDGSAVHVQSIPVTLLP
jgi:Immunoglobulin-like domain of bacterial spore germination/Sporulation and spore germination